MKILSDDYVAIEKRNAKLEAANKAMLEALRKIANCRQGNVVKYIQTVDSLALDAIDTADEIMKGNG